MPAWTVHAADRASGSPPEASAAAAESHKEAAPDASTGVLHRWSAHPARERPAIGAAALMVIVLLSLATGMTAGSMAWSLLAAFLLLAAVRRFFLTSDHVVDGEGVSARHLLGSRFLSYRRIQRVVVDERGGFVGISKQRSWLDPIRGVHLTFPASIDIPERERIAATIRERAGIAAKPAIEEAAP